MKLKKLAKVLLVSTLAVGLLTGCSSGKNDEKTIVVGASSTPHADILEAAKPILEKDGYTLIPFKVYFNKNKVKVLLGLCKGKKTYDKREVLKEKEIKRKIEREIKSY